MAIDRMSAHPGLSRVAPAAGTDGIKARARLKAELGARLAGANDPAAPAGPAHGDWPSWVPEAAQNYLAHTEGGRTIRALAREAQVAPSTILRRVRRVESSRDDPLVDAALRDLAGRTTAVPLTIVNDDDWDEDRTRLATEAAPILRRLTEPGAVLAVARDMDRGVVVREGPGGEPQRLAVVERRLAEAMGLRDWIACPDALARILRYRITAQGRAALRRVLAEVPVSGFAEMQTPFLARSSDVEAGEERRLRHMRSILPESPLSALARRRNPDGALFLHRELVAAGERLREDFELAQRGLRIAPDWDALLAGPPSGEREVDHEPGRGWGPQAARARVARALRDLGPDLADVALRCCCLLEGLETMEKRMGWSARSGKVVLRIALGRLRRHFREADERSGGLIG